MHIHFLKFSLGFILFLALSLTYGCSNQNSHKTTESSTTELTKDTTSVKAKQDSIIEETIYHFDGSDEILEYLDNSSDASKYKDGVICTMAKEVPEYAEKLLSELTKYSKFIIVDKAALEVILYDKYGQILKQYGMACAKNFGTKHKKGDSRTPEGFFSLEGKYNSEDWLFTDDNGYTSPKKGQFGPRFLRIKIPNTSQIGIHGTCAPWSIGHRVSHGCIRILNENILELYDLVEIGMPVIIIPGKRDRAVNREEGYTIPYFPTNAKYAMTEKEKQLKVNDKPVDNNINHNDSIIQQDVDSTIQISDSISTPNEEVELPDSTLVI